jgi:hypothetical protein
MSQDRSLERPLRRKNSQQSSILSMPDQDRSSIDSCQIRIVLRETAVRSGSFFERQLAVDRDFNLLSRVIRMVHSLHIYIFTYSDHTVTMAFLD